MQTNDEFLRALQGKCLEGALYFKEFCDRHNLLFYFCGGGCIGALRNGGFIPWDDDIDVFMPREDYEKLKALWNKECDNPRFVCVCSGPDFVDHNLFLTIRDKSTTKVLPYQKQLDMPHGVALDVLPLDGYPDSNFARKVQVFWAMVYSLYCAQLVPVNHGKKMTMLGKFALGIVPSKKLRYKIWRFAERQMIKHKIKDCQSITELCSGPYYMKKRYPKQAFDSAVLKDFEGHQMPLPVGYDAYLKTAFGNYMELPPVEKQKPHHDFYFCDLTRGYETYHGQFPNEQGKAIW